jgi:peptidoglycan/xylan/chitin deacetylase (PgdA/CDA1 family)
LLKSLVIKVPIALAATAFLSLGHGATAWMGALAAFAVGAGLLGRLVFDVNSSFWAKTLWRADVSSTTVALTFDDGPDPEFTPRILEILETKGVPAAFFVVGERVRAHPDLVARIDGAGHVVANHSDQHGIWFHFKLWAGVRRELKACNAAIASAIGKEPRLFRSPQGFKNPALGDVLRELGLLAIGWQVRGFDAVEPNPRRIAQRIVSRIRPGGVVQMHDGATEFARESRRATLEALPVIIDRVRAAGLQFVRLDALLRIDAYREHPGVTGRASPRIAD